MSFPHPKKRTDMSILKGKGAYQNYNAHYIPAAAAYFENNTCMTYYSCYQEQKST